MSGENSSDLECSEALARIYEYIDNEMTCDGYARVRSHLEACSFCLEKYGLAQAVKTLVHRSCGCDEVPEDLRNKVLARISQIRARITETE